MRGSIKDNVLKHGVGAINIDACRIPIQGTDNRSGGTNGHSRLTFGEGVTSNEDSHIAYEASDQGRFPSNVLGEILQADYQKYFYCPKVSRRERHTGFELPPAMFGGVQGAYDENGERFAVGFDDRAEGKVKKKKYDPLGHIPTDPSGKYDNGGYSANQETLKASGNNHPTVKPIALMKYLIKLITPKGGRVLDPFNGSGSTGCAAVELGHEYVGIELDPKYVEIATKRIEAWNKEETSFKELFTECR
jgi:site-specific DNA-methyltransferase (adenine-specific)